MSHVFFVSIHCVGGHYVSIELLWRSLETTTQPCYVQKNIASLRLLPCTYMLYIYIYIQYINNQIYIYIYITHMPAILYFCKLCSYFCYGLCEGADYIYITHVSWWYPHASRVDLCNWHIPIHPVNTGFPIYGWRWIKSPVFMAVYGGFPHIRQSNVAGNSPFMEDFPSNPQNPCWLMISWGIITIYNNPRTGNPVNQYFILYDRGVLNSAHLITFPSRTGAVWPTVP